MLYRRIPAVRTAGLLVLLALGAQLRAAAAEQVVVLDAAQREAGGVRFVAAVPATSADGAGASLQLSGRVVVPNAALDVLLANVEGRLEAVLVDPGQAVRSGQPLLRIRSAEILGLQRELLAARSRADVARSRAERDAQLHAEGIIAANRLQESEAARADAEARLREQQHLLQLAGVSAAAVSQLRGPDDISATVTLNARRAGQVLAIEASAGQAVQAGDPLLQVAALDALWVELQATRAQAAGIHQGDPVRVAGCEVAGQVSATAVQLDAQSQTVTVRVTIPKPAGCLSPNQFVEAQVAPRPQASGLLAVPDTGVIQHEGRTYVFVLREDGLLPVVVNVERRANGQAWLRGSLRAGDEVAASGLAAIKGSWLGLGATAGSR